jgi:hypothetical protein
MKKLSNQAKLLGGDLRQTVSAWSSGARLCASTRLGVLVIICFTLCYAAPTAAQSTALTSSAKEAVFPNLFAAGKRTFPEIGNGHVWSFRPVLRAPSNDVIHLDSLAGDAQQTIGFWLPAAETIWISGVTVTPAGRILVIGTYSRATGSLMTNFVAEVDSTGHVVATHDLGDYEPSGVCSAKDGTIWMLGQVWSDELQQRSYMMLRNYSLTGQLVNAYLDRGQLEVAAINSHPQIHSDRPWIRGTVMFLRCGGDSIGAYVGAGPAKTWVEIRAGDGMMQTWRAEQPRGARITGFAFLGTHQVYASFDMYDPNHSVTGRGLYKLDCGRYGEGIWAPVSGMVSPVTEARGFAMVVGGDGSNVVYLRNGSKSPDGKPLCCQDAYFSINPTLFWGTQAELSK